jgi:glycosyltransferase involved in cell wall biosynthesis
MAQFMKLSVVIPCFNAVDTIAEQLNALMAQTVEPWEVIVADNGSTDGSVAVVRQYLNQLPQLRMVDASACKGAAHARNVGAAAATGDAIAFCDADDEVSPQWVAAMIEALTQYDFVASCFEATKLNTPELLESRHIPQTDGLQTKYDPVFLPHAGACGLGVKRSIHAAVGGFDETLHYFEDPDYCWRVQLAGYPLQFVPNAVIHIRCRSNIHQMFEQARVWGEYSVLLCKKYQALGMPPANWQAGIREWFILLQRLVKVSLQKEKFDAIAWTLGWRLGRLKGSLRYQVLAL